MASTVRRIRRCVHKVTTAAGLDAEQAELAADVVFGISKTGSCMLSEIGRALNEDCELIDTERRLSEGLAAPNDETELLRLGYLEEIASVAAKMPFIIVDPTELTKPFGKAFEHLDVVRDASSPRKELKPGYWSVQIEATDEKHRNLPLWSEAFSTTAPDYVGWKETFWSAMDAVVARVGHRAVWLFDRGFDDIEHFCRCEQMQLQWVVRQKQDRHVLLGNGQRILVSELAASLTKPHRTKVAYVCKKTHNVKHWPVSFAFAPVELPDLEGRFYLIVITTGRDEDLVLLTNVRITRPAEAARIVRAYVRRWGIEEGIRFWKQGTNVEGFRVRSYDSIRRLTFLSTMAWGIQALWLFRAPTLAGRYIARVKVFIKHVLFPHYRLWDGVSAALLAES